MPRELFHYRWHVITLWCEWLLNAACMLKYGGENRVNRLRYRVWREREEERLEIYSTRKRCALCATAYSQLRHQSDLFIQQCMLQMYMSQSPRVCDCSFRLCTLHLSSLLSWIIRPTHSYRTMEYTDTVLPNFHIVTVYSTHQSNDITCRCLCNYREIEFWGWGFHSSTMGYFERYNLGLFAFSPYNCDDNRLTVFL